MRIEKHYETKIVLHHNVFNQQKKKKIMQGLLKALIEIELSLIWIHL